VSPIEKNDKATGMHKGLLQGIDLPKGQTTATMKTKG
jgi:hypothetical protein